MFKQWLTFLASLLVVGGTALTVPAAEGAPKAGVADYHVVAGWPRLAKDIQLGQVSAVATDSADRVFVFHRGKHPVLVFDRDGNYLRSWGDDLVKTAHGLRIDRDENVWITDISRHVVLKCDPNGKVLMMLGKPDQPGDTRNQFNKPTDVAFAPSGEFYVSDGYGNARVVKFSKDGKYLKEWGKKGGGEGEFNLPHAICVDAQGSVVVGDRENNRIQVFDPDGRFLATWREGGAPFGLFLSPDGYLLVADGRADWVKVLDLHGKVLGRFGEKGQAPGQFRLPHAICMDRHGAIYVTEITGQRVQKFVAR